MDVKGVTKQKIAAVKDELLALFRREKSLDAAKEDLRQFLGKESTQQVLERVAICTPPSYNIVQVVLHVKSDASLSSKIRLPFENVGLYALTGMIVWSWLPPPLYLIALVGQFGAFAPVEAAWVESKASKFAEEKRLRNADTVGYIRMEDVGDRDFFGHKKLTQVEYPIDNPRGKKDIVGYLKLVNGKVHRYRPKFFADSDTGTKGKADIWNWSKGTKLDYYIAQTQTFAYQAIAYAATYIATNGKGFLFPEFMNAAINFFSHIF